jgi:penicillin G amidase
MTVVHETIEVKGETSRQVDLLFTRHGPIVHSDPEQRRAFAIRSVWFERAHQPISDRPTT